MASDFFDPAFVQQFSVDPAQGTRLGVDEQSDGGVIVHGQTGIIRLEPDGMQDMAFASDGIFEVEPEEHYPTLLYVDAEGRIVFSQPSNDSNHWDIVRLLKTGELDLSFGTAGVAKHPNSGFWVNVVTIMPDGSLVVVAQEGPTPHHVLRKLTSFGQIDETFSFPEIDADLLISGADTANGELVLLYRSAPDSGDLSLVKLTATGAVDESFGIGGTLSVPAGPGSGVSFEVDAADRIVIGHQTNTNESRTVIQRFLTNGVLDTSFGEDGEQEIDFAIADLYESEYDGPTMGGFGFCPEPWRMIDMHVDSQNEVLLIASLSRDTCFEHGTSRHYAILSVGDDGNESLQGFFNDAERSYWFSKQGHLASFEGTFYGNPSLNIFRLGKTYTRWHNVENPLDVNGDDSISPMDALNVINTLQLIGSSNLFTATPSIALKVDTNNDHFLSSNDVLLVVNQLNRDSALAAAISASQQGSSSSSNGEGEGESKTTMPIDARLFAPVSPYWTATDLGSRPAAKKSRTK